MIMWKQGWFKKKQNSYKSMIKTSITIQNIVSQYV